MSFRNVGIALLILAGLDDLVPSATLFLIPHESVGAPEPSGEPLQGAVPEGLAPWSEAHHGDSFLLTPRASYDVSARVGDRDLYRWSATNALMPWDLVLTWGRLTREPYLSKVSYVHTRRFYNWSTDDSSLDLAYIRTHSANVHLIADAPRVRAALSRVRAGDVVRLEGELVDVTGPEGVWKTSLTRDDAGAGACETMHVRALTVGTKRYR